MKIIYTESASIELENFKEKRKEDLERLLKNNKYVFGDDILEITASDIRDAERYFKVSKLSKSNFQAANMLLKLYMIIGVMAISGGVFYSELVMMFRNPIQIALILSGILILLVSFLASYYLRVREYRRYELERKYREQEVNCSTNCLKGDA